MLQKFQPEQIISARLDPRSRNSGNSFGRSSGSRIDLLAGLPVHSDSGKYRRSSPITAAGPRRNRTVFPFTAASAAETIFIHLSKLSTLTKYNPNSRQVKINYKKFLPLLTKVFKADQASFYFVPAARGLLPLTKLPSDGLQTLYQPGYRYFVRRS